MKVKSDSVARPAVVAAQAAVQQATQVAELAGRPQAPTMSDVAKLAGVSPMTVSRVMNGDTNVREKTRNLVDAAVAALNYVPNQAARRLAGSRPIRVGFLYSNPSAGYLSEFLVGLLNQASPNNVQLVVEKYEADAHGIEQARRLIANGVDGIILPPPLCDTPNLIDLIAASGTPAVTVACGQPDSRVGAVSIDDYQAAYAMTSHLISLGHQRIGFVNGHPNQSASARRLAGFKAAIAEKNAYTGPEMIVQGMFTYRSGLDAAGVELRGGDRDVFRSGGSGRADRCCDLGQRHGSHVVAFTSSFVRDV